MAKCEAIDLKSSLIFIGAKFKNGFYKYGVMSFEHFMKIMGNKEICSDDF